jgi:two-component system OmpR family sensor kinase
MTFTTYARDSKALTIQQLATSALAGAGSCSLLSPAAVSRHARALGVLLGPPGVDATIISPRRVVLASVHSGTVTVPRGGRSPTIPGGSVMAGLAPRPLSTGDSVSACRAGTVSLPTTPPPSVLDGDMLYIAVPLGPRSHPAGYAILGRSFAAEDALARRAKLGLWLGALIVLLASVVVTPPIMNRALRPLSRVTATAEAIAAGDFAQRANLASSADEVGRLGKAFDIMVDRMQEALAGAVASEERMRRFLADASHELRTPLTVLSGTSEILLRQRRLAPEESVAALRAINDEARRLSRLVDNLLELSRIDAGQALNPHPVALSPFLEKFVERYAPAWPERAIELDGQALAGALAEVDPDALTRVLTNLVDNAARYSATGEPIHITAEATDGTVSIAVCDAGPGLSPDDAARIFERFYRGARSRSGKKTGGSGLGLAIVQALVRQSRGEISIDTGPDRGTVIAVTLPQPVSA